MSTITNQSQLEIHKEVLNKWIKDLDSGEIDFVGKYVDPDIIIHYPGGVEVRGIDELNKSSRNSQIGFPDLKHTIDIQLAEDDMVASRFIVTGTHLGEYMGVSPTGNKLEVTVIEITRFKDGKVIEAWLEFDSKAFDKVLSSQ
jgi:predicted ester cyclase